MPLCQDFETENAWKIGICGHFDRAILDLSFGKRDKPIDSPRLRAGLLPYIRFATRKLTWSVSKLILSHSKSIKTRTKTMVFWPEFRRKPLQPPLAGVDRFTLAVLFNFRIKNRINSRHFCDRSNRFKVITLLNLRWLVNFRFCLLSVINL